MENESLGRSLSGRATAAEPVVSALRDGIPSADLREEWPEQNYAQAVRDLASMDHVSADIAGVLRDCADIIDSNGKLAEKRGKLYYELLFEVGMVHKGETRHETALRYIRRAEQGSCGGPMQVITPPNNTPHPAHSETAPERADRTASGAI